MALPRNTFDLVVQYIGLEKDIKSFCDLMAKILHPERTANCIIRIHDTYNPKSEYMKKVQAVRKKANRLVRLTEEEHHILMAYECFFQEDIKCWRWALAQVHFTQCHAMTKFLLHQELLNGPHAHFARIWCKNNFSRNHLDVLRNPLLYLDHIRMFSFEWSERLRDLHASLYSAYVKVCDKQQAHYDEYIKRHMACLDKIRKVHRVEERWSPTHCRVECEVEQKWKWLNQCY